MSASDRDTSSRLSDALDEVFERAAPTLPPREPKPSGDVWDDRATDGDDAPVLPSTEELPAADLADPSNAVETAEPYVLPEIVPATPDDEPPAPEAPAAVPVPPAQPVGPPPPTTGWTDHMHAPAANQGPGLRAPGRRPRVRRVTRVLRHVDPWSTFKVALLFSVVAYVVGLTAGVLLWRVADNTGTLDNVERWFTQFGWETFEFDGGEIFHNAWIIGLFGVVALTGGLVLLVTLFNLVSDIIGGVRVTVLEEEVVERTVSSTRRYVVRRPGVTADPAERQDWDVDSDDPVEAPTAVQADWSVDDDAADDPVAEWSVDDDGAGEPTAEWSVDDEPVGESSAAKPTG